MARTIDAGSGSGASITFLTSELHGGRQGQQGDDGERGKARDGASRRPARQSAGTVKIQSSGPPCSIR